MSGDGLPGRLRRGGLQRLRPLGLRSRLTAVLACGALAVTMSMAVLTYESTRHVLLQERERSAVRSAGFDVNIVRIGVSVPDPDIGAVLGTLDPGETRRPVVRRYGQWYARGADAGLTEAIPQPLQALVEGGQPGVQRIDLNGDPALVVGVPLRDEQAAYYEVSSLAELNRTLAALASVLALAALGTTSAAALLGRRVSSRVLQPVAGVASAARALAAGDLGARVDRDEDPDLDTLAVSFNTMVEQLAARIASDRRFAADVSHELRSPLQTLTAATSVLDRRADTLDPRTAEAARLVRDEVQRFSSLVTDLLELAKADRPAERTDVDVTALALRVCGERGRVEAVDGPAELCGFVEPRRLRQVLVNLVDNAERHGGGLARLGLGRDGSTLWLEVDDTGPGVPAEERTLVFDRFARGRAAGARGAAEGAGLGLALVREHVLAHRGSVEVVDAAGGGARFRVRLPGAAR